MRHVIVLVIAIFLLWQGYLLLGRLGVLGEGPLEEGGLQPGALSETPFPVTFREQYLCNAFGEWLMAQEPRDGHVTVVEDGLERRLAVLECLGPFTDSQNLCHALKRQGLSEIRLWEGRVFRCW